jgi:hypothetical protein
MKGRIKFLSKIIIMVAVFAQTTTADTMALPIFGTDGLSEAMYLTLCGIGLIVLGARGKRDI